MPTPTADQQARFVTNLQRLLTEGEFVNTYKFALLLSLARWAVENPDHDEQEPLDVAVLAPHFAELYWPHVRPFAVRADRVAEAAPFYGHGAGAGWAHTLVQDRGQRTAQQVPRVLKKIRAAHAHGGAWHELPANERDALLREIRASIATMPLPRLHRVRDSDEPMRFLYQPGPGTHRIRFEAGMVGCLVHFAPLVEETVRAAWVRFVLRCNPHVLGASSGVEAFLFPDSRASLQALRAPLQAVQGDACFYCDKGMRGTPAVDHFLPWSRYRRDLGHNFVLAHADCNQHKRDHLASLEHLQRWCARNDEHGAELAEHFDAARLPHDWPTLRRVAGSLYQLAEATDARVWQQHRMLVPLDAHWRRVLRVG